jgi:hypothetical protein
MIIYHPTKTWVLYSLRLIRSPWEMRVMINQQFL